MCDENTALGVDPRCQKDANLICRLTCRHRLFARVPTLGMCQSREQHCVADFGSVLKGRKQAGSVFVHKCHDFLARPCIHQSACQRLFVLCLHQLHHRLGRLFWFSKKRTDFGKVCFLIFKQRHHLGRSLDFACHFVADGINCKFFEVHYANNCVTILIIIVDLDARSNHSHYHCGIHFVAAVD